MPRRLLEAAHSTGYSDVNGRARLNIRSGADGLRDGGVAAAEELAGFAQVGSNLSAKLGGAGKFSFVAQPFPEAQLEAAFGEFAREIKQMGFDAQ